ncbi:hypothetical protein bcgnr5401_42310 [Bacillus cereus]
MIVFQVRLCRTFFYGIYEEKRERYIKTSPEYKNKLHTYSRNIDDL